MPRKPKIKDQQPELSCPPASVGAATVSASIQEYRALDGDWRIGRWELFSAELGVAAARLPEFHAWVSRSPRAWTIVRRLFAVMPLVVPLGGDPDDFRPWSRSELCAALGISEPALGLELEAVRSGWSKLDAPRTQPEPEAEPPKLGQIELVSSDDDLLREFGFPVELFSGPDADAARADKVWFCQRVREWERLLRDRNASRLAVQALIKDLRLRRANIKLVRDEMKSSASEDMERKRMTAIRDLSESIRAMERDYQEQIEALQELAPWFNVTGKQVTVTGSIGEMIKAIQEYESRGDTKLIDGIFSALEIQVMTRTSQQVPTPQYRAGWVTYLNASKGWLWDPDARSEFKQEDLARLDRAWKDSVQAYNDRAGVPLPDLEADGPDSEYPKLVDV